MALQADISNELAADKVFLPGADCQVSPSQLRHTSLLANCTLLHHFLFWRSLSTSLRSDMPCGLPNEDGPLFTRHESAVEPSSFMTILMAIERSVRSDFQLPLCLAAPIKSPSDSICTLPGILRRAIIITGQHDANECRAGGSCSSSLQFHLLQLIAQGRPVILVLACRHQMRHRQLDETVRLIIYTLDNSAPLADTARNPLGQTLCLIDLSGLFFGS